MSIDDTMGQFHHLPFQTHAQRCLTKKKLFAAKHPDALHEPYHCIYTGESRADFILYPPNMSSKGLLVGDWAELMFGPLVSTPN